MRDEGFILSFKNSEKMKQEPLKVSAGGIQKEKWLYVLMSLGNSFTGSSEFSYRSRKVIKKLRNLEITLPPVIKGFGFLICKFS